MNTANTGDLVSDRIIFTEAATAKVAEILAAEANPDLYLRIFVRGGGCEGFQYGFEFADAIEQSDLTISKNGVSLLADAMSYQQLLGARIDYQRGTDGEGFVIDNPNEPAGCSCGASCDSQDA